MANAYIKPGVSVDELLTPNISPVVTEPTSICIIGPAQGYEQRTEIILLDDNTPVALAAANADVNNISVVDASNVTLDPFTSPADYVIDDSDLNTTGVATIVRSMQTAITNGEQVVTYHENPVGGTADFTGGSPDVVGNAFTSFVALDRTDSSILPSRDTDTDEDTLRVMSAGVVPASEYTITGANTAVVTIVRDAGVILSRFQTIYVDYDDGTGEIVLDLGVTLDWAAGSDQDVSLPANSLSHVIKTAPGVTDDATVLYIEGTTTDGDYIVTGTDTNTVISRSSGSTGMGVDADRLQVQVSYRATPSDYWLATRLFSQADVEDKYGPAFNSNGDISSAASFGALIAFQNGASSVILQALFTEGSPRVSASGAVSDWTDTLASLQNVEDANVLIPLINSGGLVNSDAQVLQIFQAVSQHINYMQATDQFAVAVMGEDGTGIAGAPSTIQSHGRTLGNSLVNLAESMALITPGSHSYSNPVTGTNINIGGQFVACAIAGQIAARPIQETLTRKSIQGVNGINTLRSEREKNEDAASGLMVVEARGGLIRVRHAITTAVANIQSSTAQRELNVVRAKHFVMESVRDVLDTQVVGQVIADARAAFSVQLAVTNKLEELVGNGVISTYNPANVQARQLPNTPTTVEVRFSYTPSFPLNNINVKFSLDTSSGALISEVTTQGV